MAKLRTSVLVDELTGKAGSVVFVKSRVGTVIRPRRTPTNPNSSAQLAIRKNLTTASTLFRALTASKLAQWQAYAATQTHTQPDTGHTYHPTAISAFVGLATKVLQAGGTVDANFNPPTGPYSGDALTLSVAAGTGKLTFTPSGGNTSANTKVEILLETLPSPNRKPTLSKMRTKTFLTFPSGVLSRDVTVPVGIYGIGYRFVNTTTGQMTPVVMLPTTTVSLSLADGESKPSTKKAA